jgi:ribonuclease P protein component
MVSVIACMIAPGGPSSSRAGKKVGNVSPPDLESLRSPGDFRKALAEGRRYRCESIVLVRSLGRDGSPRLGLVVAKSAGSAVIRNRIKRRLRHACRRLRFEPGTDYVIIASRPVAHVPYPKLVGWIERALRGVGDA